MRKLRVLAAALGALLVSLAPVSMAGANPPDVPAGYKLAYNFNLIGFPAGQEYTGGCGEGHRIFVNRGANHAHIEVRDHNDGWHVADCNATADNRAELHTDEVGTFKVYARILGKPSGTLRICAEILYDPDTHAHLCELGTFTLHRESGQSKFQLVPDSLFDASLYNIIWSVWTNFDYRIAQFRVYKVA